MTARRCAWLGILVPIVAMMLLAVVVATTGSRGRHDWLGGMLILAGGPLACIAGLGFAIAAIVKTRRAREATIGTAPSTSLLVFSTLSGLWCGALLLVVLYLALSRI
jgi:hypothetical protein